MERLHPRIRLCPDKECCSLLTPESCLLLLEWSALEGPAWTRSGRCSLVSTHLLGLSPYRKGERGMKGERHQKDIVEQSQLKWKLAELLIQVQGCPRPSSVQRSLKKNTCHSATEARKKELGCFAGFGEPWLELQTKLAERVYAGQSQ